MSNNLSKYRIKERLVRGFITAAAIPAAAAVVALITLIIVANIYAGALTDYGFAQGDVGKTLTYFSETRSALRGVIGYDEMSAIEKMKNEHDENVALFEKSFAALESYMVSEENKINYNDISTELVNYWKLENEILTLGMTTDRAVATEAQNRAMSELMPLFENIYAELTDIMEVKVERGNMISGIMTIVCFGLVAAIAVIIILSMIFSTRLGKKIADGIAKPMLKLGDRLGEFSKGDLFSPFPEVETKDEVADMIQAANEMAQALEFIISDMEYTLGEMADSNFTVRSKDSSRYIGDFQQLFEASRKLRNNMVETMRFIEESSIQVTAGAGNLAEGATEQASAVEELQATIMTITEAAEKAAENAEGAYNQSQEYADMADDSSTDIKAMVEAMERISDASKKIGNIISEIESIASQTNLLSLNASIEAARAGEAGRGFAVVADQIRQLAEQSSKSAVDTRTLIEGAMQEVENGNKVADRAVASIEVVVDGIRKVASASKELSVVSASQAETMKEAEDGVNQISDVVQTNAAVAQESSATSQELSAQAASLDALIAKFKLPANR